MPPSSERASQAAAVLIAAALPLTAGCLGTAQATAMEQASEADQIAEAWSEQAQLVSAMGLEGKGWPAHLMPEAGAVGDEATWERTQEDEDVGDGHAVLWLYRYTASDREESKLVLVDQDGQVVGNLTTEHMPASQPIEGWEIDSDEAAEIAAEENQGIEEASQAGDHLVVLRLSHDDERGRAAWTITALGGGDGGFGGGIVRLDATTGEVLESRGGFRSR